MNSMNDATIDINKSNLSMRRTLLTLLAAIGAFGVLTASYATAELPNGHTDGFETGLTADAR